MGTNGLTKKWFNHLEKVLSQNFLCKQGLWGKSQGGQEGENGKKGHQSKMSNIVLYEGTKQNAIQKEPYNHIELVKNIKVKYKNLSNDTKLNLKPKPVHLYKEKTLVLTNTQCTGVLYISLESQLTFMWARWIHSPEFIILCMHQDYMLSIIWVKPWKYIFFNIKKVYIYLNIILTVSSGRI